MQKKCENYKLQKTYFICTKENQQVFLLPKVWEVDLSTKSLSVLSSCGWFSHITSTVSNIKNRCKDDKLMLRPRNI